MNFTIDDHGSYTLIKIGGSLNLRTVVDLEQPFDALVENFPDKMIFDLQSLTFIDSSGLAVFVNIISRAKGSDASIVFINIPTEILKIFQLCSIDEILVIKNSLEDALEV